MSLSHMSQVAIERAIEYRGTVDQGIGTRAPFTESYGLSIEET
jgi:hypothetical protein